MGLPVFVGVAKPPQLLRVPHQLPVSQFLTEKEREGEGERGRGREREGEGEFEVQKYEAHNIKIA